MSEKKELILIGYWAGRVEEHNNPYPHPSKLVDPEFWENFYDNFGIIKSRIIEYLDGGIPCNFYRGLSSCRLCDEHVGSSERTDGKYIWPEKLSHYIDKHDVILPEEFLRDAIHNIKVEKVLKEDFWIKWGEKFK
ncbi:MAG: hypothetical protein ACFFCS_02515 [Candidatus Hodarchaeota archaeon]